MYLYNTETTTMKLKYKSKPFGILSIGILIVFIGAIAKITKEDFASTILAVGLVVEAIGLFVFFKWYKKARTLEKR